MSLMDSLSRNGKTWPLMIAGRASPRPASSACVINPIHSRNSKSEREAIFSESHRLSFMIRFGNVHHPFGITPMTYLPRSLSSSVFTV